MILKGIALTNFKNIAGARLEFSPKINCFLGDNGMGKSNMLDALYFLSFTKSFGGATDALVVRRGETFATLTGDYLRRDLDEQVTAGIVPGRGKSFKRSGKAYRRISDHIGAFPLVMLSPADSLLATGEPADRRRFLDQIISQSDSRYLDTLIRYNATIDQRNRLLRSGSTDTTLYEALELQLEAAADYIVAARQATVDHLRELFTPYYRAIAGDTEVARIDYRHTDYPEGLAAHMAAARQRDLALGYTSAGPHRDDLELTVDDMPVRRTASQGQTKTFTTALRLAQYDLLVKLLGIKPLLLLDDIFDKLDAHRVSRIMAIVADTERFGQIFITDTNRRHLDDIIADLGSADAYRLWHVVDGTFTPINV